MDYCTTEKIWYDIIDKPKQGASYLLNLRHLTNVPVDNDSKVEQNATHPALLGIKQDDMVEVPPQNRNIPKADPSPVRRSVLESGIKKVRWESTQVPPQKVFWGTARENFIDKRSYLQLKGKSQ